jgi:glycosyltransferase involved in cell wall biosynthesis
MHMPAISIVTPCYNSAPFVGETARSVFAQTLDDLEVIFIDDGSTDETVAILDGLVAEHGEHRVRILRSADQGLAACRNLGIVQARGRYILPLDADDLIAPEMLADCTAVLDSEPGVAIVYTDRQDFGEVERIWSAGRFELERLKYFNQIGSCSLFRRTVWEAVGGYRGNVDGFDDWNFWIAAAACGFSARHVPAPHFKHRTRAGSLMTRIVDDYERLYAQIVANNRAAYTPSEVAQAERFLATLEPAAFLRASRAIFMSRLPGASPA